MRTFDNTDHDDNVDKYHQYSEETDSVEMFILNRFIFSLKNVIRLTVVLVFKCFYCSL